VFKQLSLEDYTAKYHGPCYSPEHDRRRLSGQILRVFNAMISARWLSLREIAAITGDPEASVSAQIRHLDNIHGIPHDKRRRGEPGRGLWEYQLLEVGG